MISVRQLFKSFGKNEVLKGLDIDFKPNRITAVLGPNSSGKTTLMKSILGMVIPDRGKITFNGQDVSHSCEYRNNIGYLSQIARFPENLTVNELFDMITDIRSKGIDKEVLVEYFDLYPFLDKRLGTLSGGTRQKVNIVQALMFDSSLLLLDEPTAGLDPVSIIKLKDLIFMEKQKGKTILITSHIMSFVEEMADEVIFILDGKIHFRGHPRQIKNAFVSSTLEQAIAKALDGLPPIGLSNGHIFQNDLLTGTKTKNHA